MQTRQPADIWMETADGIDRSSPLPLYVQIKRRLLQMIASWDRHDLRFHTDDELCQLFKVSRMTVRQAVQALVNEGHLTRIRGVGTFVGSGKMDERFTPDMDFIDQWAGSGRPLVMTLRRLERMPCPAAYAASLGVVEGAEVLYIERLRTSGGIPISLDYRYIVADCADVFDRDSVERFSLLDLLRQRVELDRGIMRIEATSANPDIAEILQVLPNDPVLGRHLVYLDVRERPIMAGYSIYRADQARYVVTVPVSKASAGGPANIISFSSELRVDGHKKTSKNDGAKR